MDDSLVDGELSLSKLAISDTPPAKCKICHDLSVELYVFWAKLEEGARNGCVYCDMVARTARHFKLASFVLSEDETAQFLRRGKIYSSSGKEVDITVRVLPARQKESWKNLRLSLTSLEEKTPLIPGMFLSRTTSPVVQYYTASGRFLELQ